MLAILNVVSVADVDCCINLILQLWPFWNRRNLDGFVHCSVNSCILKEVCRNGGETVLGGFAHAGTFFRIPSQYDVAARSHVFKHLVKQFFLIFIAWIEPHACRTTGGTDVVYIGYSGPLADEQAVVAAAPIVVEEVSIDIQRSGHGQ